MGHRTCVLLGVFACFLGLNINLWSQSIPAANGIRGYLDPRTGIFHSMPHPDLQDRPRPCRVGLGWSPPGTSANHPGVRGLDGMLSGHGTTRVLRF